MSNLLFVCSKNQWRSPTAELLFKNHPVHNARSAGTSEKARIKLNQKLIAWADIIYVMERKHKELLLLRFPGSMNNKKVEVLNIPDKYQFGDAALIQLLKQALPEYFNKD
ncbi:phosphotyrosine protein phosphatase [Mucilaginibacter puniceus]